jgi:hypothetical protein
MGSGEGLSEGEGLGVGDGLGDGKGLAAPCSDGEVFASPTPLQPTIIKKNANGRYLFLTTRSP